MRECLPQPLSLLDCTFIYIYIFRFVLAGSLTYRVGPSLPPVQDYEETVTTVAVGTRKLTQQKATVQADVQTNRERNTATLTHIAKLEAELQQARSEQQGLEQEHTTLLATLKKIEDQFQLQKKLRTIVEKAQVAISSADNVAAVEAVMTANTIHETCIAVQALGVQRLGKVATRETVAQAAAAATTASARFASKHQDKWASTESASMVERLALSAQVQEMITQPETSSPDVVTVLGVLDGVATVIPAALQDAVRNFVSAVAIPHWVDKQNKQALKQLRRGVSSREYVDIVDSGLWCITHEYTHLFPTLVKEGMASLKSLQSMTIADIRALFPELIFKEQKEFHAAVESIANSVGTNSNDAPALPVSSSSTPAPPVSSPVGPSDSRFVEVGLTPKDIAAHIKLGSVTGVFANGVPKFTETTPPLESKVPAIAGAAYGATKFAGRKLRREVNDGTAQSSTTDCHGLSVDEIAAINLYTQEAVYPTLNEYLRAQNRKQLKPFFPYLALLLTALMKLPSVPKCTVWRGVKGVDLRSLHLTGDTITWYSFSSCTTDGDVASSFLGTSGPRTLFAVTVENGKDIQMYSSYEGEKEILVVAGTPLVVDTSMAAPGANGLVLINLTEEKLPAGVKMIS